MSRIRLAAGLVAPAALILLCMGGFAMAARAGALELYVSPHGNDTWSGTLAEPNKAGTDGPFATLERARDELRHARAAGKLASGAAVEVAAGAYELARPFELTAEDSAEAVAPIEYRAAPGAEVRLVAGRAVTGWKRVADPAVLDRLDPAARGKVWQADLRALGVADFGGVVDNRLELFFNDRPMTIARWPNEGFVQIAGIVVDDGLDVRGTRGSSVGKFAYDGDRPRRWLAEKDLWLHGYWFWDWSDQRQKVESIDPDAHIITLAKPYHGYGYRPGQWWYALNAVSELDVPGEWYLDRETGLLYFYPPTPVGKGRAVVSVLPSVVTAREASHVTLRGFILEAARGTTATIAGGEGCRIVGCAIRNSGADGVSIGGGRSHQVVGCDIYDVGSAGVSMDGGDRPTLTPAHHLVDNCHIHHWGRWVRMYSGAVACNGVGNTVSHCLLDNAPHTAIFFSGNDHVFEYNEIHSVCLESNDAGAIYAGRDWTWRGTVVRYNYFHHINGFRAQGCNGVYLDDMLCGTEIRGNLFYRVVRAAFIGGGRDNIVENNCFVDCSPALHVDARAMNWAADSVPTTMVDRLKEMPYLNDLWRARFPALTNILAEGPAEPRGNVVARNICWGGSWDDVEGVARPMVKLEDNLVGQDPKFRDLSRLDFRLRPDSPALKLGFRRLPIERMGPYRSPDRASWPVTSQATYFEPTPPPPPKPAGPPPVYRAPKSTVALNVDGLIQPEEWGGARRAAAMPIREGINGEKLAPATRAWVQWDDEALMVAIENDLDPARPLTRGTAWGQDDAVEVAVRNFASAKAPILVLRGYTSGHFEPSGEAGATPAAVRRAEAGVLYAARVLGPRRWTCEWRIPWASLGVVAKPARRIQFNISVRKLSPTPLWLMWHGTGGCTWEVGRAGLLELGR